MNNTSVPLKQDTFQQLCTNLLQKTVLMLALCKVAHKDRTAYNIINNTISFLLPLELMQLIIYRQESIIITKYVISYRLALFDVFVL